MTEVECENMSDDCHPILCNCKLLKINYLIPFDHMSDDYHLKVCHCELSTVFLIGAIAAVVRKVTHFIHFNASLPIFAMRFVNKMYLFYFGHFPQPG